MFELQQLQGMPSPGIALQTRTGRDIGNVLGLELNETHLQRDELFLKTYGGRWKSRRPPSGGYNCAGHVWASRRTCIYEESDWKDILIDDGYRRTTTPVPDDVVLYVDPDEGILHIARVLSFEYITKDSRPIPWVVSKWGDAGRETCHLVDDHPFNASEFGFEVTTQYWTDRPKKRS